MRDNDLKERLFKFAVEVLRMLGKLKGGKEIDVIKYQLLKQQPLQVLTTKSHKQQRQKLILLIRSGYH